MSGLDCWSSGTGLVDPSGSSKLQRERLPSTRTLYRSQTGRSGPWKVDPALGFDSTSTACAYSFAGTTAIKDAQTTHVHTALRRIGFICLIHGSHPFSVAIKETETGNFASLRNRGKSWARLNQVSNAPWALRGSNRANVESTGGGRGWRVCGKQSEASLLTSKIRAVCVNERSHGPVRGAIRDDRPYRELPISKLA